MMLAFIYAGKKSRYYDVVKAYSWGKLALYNGKKNRQLNNMLDAVKKSLTPEQLEEAEKLIKSLRKKIKK